MRKKIVVQLAAVFLVIALTIGSVYGAFLTYKAYVEIYGWKYPLGQVEIDVKIMEPIEGLEAREDYIGEIRVWTYSNDTELVLQLLQVSHIVNNFRSFTVKVCLPLDVVFVVDVTGSMIDYLPAIREELKELMLVLRMMNKCPVQFGAVTFMDYPWETNSIGLTDDWQRVENWIEANVTQTDPGAGGAWPQSHYLGLEEAERLFDEKEESLTNDKIVVFVTDAESGFGDASDFSNAARAAMDLAAKGVKIHSVLCFDPAWGWDPLAEEQLAWYAAVSNGNMVYAPLPTCRLIPGVTSNPTWIVKLTPITPFDSFRFKLNSSPPCEKEGFYTLSVYVDFYASAIAWHDFFMVELGAHLEKAQNPPPPECMPNSPSEDFFYVGRDMITRGDWIERGYGDCAYALPYVEVKGKQMATGETTGIGDSAHEFWWREPWSEPGEKDYPYEDYLGGKSILEYEIVGPEGPPRALIDKDSDYYRPSWYCHNSSITVTLNGMTGNYILSIFFLDWDAPYGSARRKLRVNVTSGVAWDAVTLATTFPENFAAGTYTVFEVNSDGIIEIEVVNLNYPAHPERYAVIAGIFLDETSSPVTGVNFLGLDRETGGNWRPLYENEYYLLPGFNVPASNVSYTPIDKSYDETNIPSGSYDVSGGVCQYAADDARTYGEYPYIGQFAAYAWTLPFDRTASDPRALTYPEDKIYYGYPPTPLNGRIYGQWDSGEMNGLLNHFIMRLKIPEGRYIFSTYAMDFARIGRSETIEIWDESMTTLLDSQYVSGAEINEGVYVKWFVLGPRIINIKVIADPGNLNSFIEGIFLNCITCHYS